MICACGFQTDNFRQYFSSGETDFVVCKKCGLVFRRVFPTEKQLDLIYSDSYRHENIHSGHTTQESGDYAANAYSKFARRLLGISNVKILDFGAGTGQLVGRLRDWTAVAHGVEASPDARRYCLAQRDVELFDSIHEVSQNQYDMVTMIEVIEHLTELQLTLRQIAGVLKPGGLILVTTPNRLSLRARRDQGYWLDARKKFHLFLFDWRSLKTHLEMAGFVDVRRVYFGPSPVSGIRALIRNKLLQMTLLSGSLCVLARRR